MVFKLNGSINMPCYKPSGTDVRLLGHYYDDTQIFLHRHMVIHEIRVLFLWSSYVHDLTFGYVKQHSILLTTDSLWRSFSLGVFLYLCRL